MLTQMIVLLFLTFSLIIRTRAVKKDFAERVKTLIQNQIKEERGEQLAICAEGETNSKVGRKCNP